MDIDAIINSKGTNWSRAHCAEVNDEWSCSIQHVIYGVMRYHINSFARVASTQGTTLTTALFNYTPFLFYLFLTYEKLEPGQCEIAAPRRLKSFSSSSER